MSRRRNHVASSQTLEILSDRIETVSDARGSRGPTEEEFWAETMQRPVPPPRPRKPRRTQGSSVPERGPTTSEDGLVEADEEPGIVLEEESPVDAEQSSDVLPEAHPQRAKAWWTKIPCLRMFAEYHLSPEQVGYGLSFFCAAVC